MSTILHHEAMHPARAWNLHAWRISWDRTEVWDLTGTPTGTSIDFEFPEPIDLRKIQFKYNAVEEDNRKVWEPDEVIRHPLSSAPAEMWTFAFSPRVMEMNPYPADAVFRAGDKITIHAVTKRRFNGGQLYIWDAYRSENTPIYVAETGRDDARGISSFEVTLLPWMRGGFHFKLTSAQSGANSPRIWESDASNRVWRPADGNLVWIKSGQCDVRKSEFTLTPYPIEMLFPASLARPPQFVVSDVAEPEVSIPITELGVAPFEGSPLFLVGRYTALIYPVACYTLTTRDAAEEPPIARPFPVEPLNANAVSRFILGAGGWRDDSPAPCTTEVAITPVRDSTFEGGVSVSVSMGNAPAYCTVDAQRQAQGEWRARFQALPGTRMSLRLNPAAGAERKPFEWLDTRRFFTPEGDAETFFTVEGVYGLCTCARTTFAEPSDRRALMRAAFGRAVADAGIFDAREMPHGVTQLDGEVYFVVSAVHAVAARLILIDEWAAGGPVRTSVPMALTPDAIYWWCKVPAARAPAQTRYHFLLNDDVEVMDPAGRGEHEGEYPYRANFGDDPRNPRTSWSIVVDVEDVYQRAHAAPWNTMGWESHLIYELHAERFTGINPKQLKPLDLLTDELRDACARGGPGYLRNLPVTTFELLPVNSFSSVASWGYDPRQYFAIDETYGGARALADFVNTAHGCGRAVMLDVVYNHSLDSPLMRIAPDVYRNGDYCGDCTNCGHPMARELVRQALIYTWRTFGLDGFRFDDTKTIITRCAPGGWDFVGNLRWAVQKAAESEGRRWPYCVAENSDNPWAVSDRWKGVMPAQWAWDQGYRVRDVCYDLWHDDWDDTGRLAHEMNQPAGWGRPFYQAVRYAETHDRVSGQDALDQRIATRPPYGQGYQLAKAMGALVLLSNGVPLLFMGQEVGETRCFSFDDASHPVDPQPCDAAGGAASDRTRILAWFRSLIGLRNDPAKGLRGDSNYQVVTTARRTVAFTCGAGQRLFVVATFGRGWPRQSAEALGLPPGCAYKEIFNSSWPVFQVAGEQEFTNGGYEARIYRGSELNLPPIGAVVLERV